jgi:FimV-like protein
MQELKKALKIKPDLIEARRDLVIVQFASGKVDDAFAEARAIQKDFPKDATGLVLEADLYASQKKWAPAANAYREALKRRSTPPVAVRLHTMLENDGKSADATAFAAKWLKENPKDVVMRTYLGERALRNKDYKEASKFFKENVALQPENAIFLNNLAWVASELNDPAAIGYAEKAYALVDDTEHPGYLRTILLKRVKQAAVELLTDAAGRAPKAAEIRLHLAQALIGSGDKAAARKELEAILQLGADVPQRAEAQALLAKL